MLARMTLHPEFKAIAPDGDADEATRFLAAMAEILSNTHVSFRAGDRGYTLAEHGFLLSYQVKHSLALNALFYGAHNAIVSAVTGTIGAPSTRDLETYIDNCLQRNLGITPAPREILSAHQRMLENHHEAAAKVDPTVRFHTRYHRPFYWTPGMAKESLLARYKELKECFYVA